MEPMPGQLHPELLEALAGAGVEGLYAHQTDALASAHEGHTIVATGTASGKSLAFNLPVLDTLCRDRSARALYLYPTKALAQDQARALHALKLPHLRPAIYDGDTPKEERRAIRARSNLILTNPDMLHVGSLPNHAQWGDLLANLAWVVVDEAHTYRGVFGSHVANVLRRLRRLALAYGTEPRFMLASATIANPVELAERLVGDEVRLVARDGAPRAERRIAMWNPPLVDERTGARASPLGEAADLLADLVESETRTICFLRSRRGVELIHQFTRAAPGGPRPRRPGRAGGPLPGGLHAHPAARDRGQADGRRAAGGGHHGRAGAGHRRRRAGRRHLRELPRHRGLAAPDVGARRAAQDRAGAVRGRRRRAGPVLLPPPRPVPGPAGRVGDPGPRVRGDLPGPPVRRGLRAAAVAGRRGVPRRPLGARRPPPGQHGSAARARRALPAARGGLPGGEHRAPRPPRPTRWR